MTTTTRIGLGLSAALLSFSIALAPAAFAQDKMGKDGAMKKEDDVQGCDEERRWHDEEGRHEEGAA